MYELIEVFIFFPILIIIWVVENRQKSMPQLDPSIEAMDEKPFPILSALVTPTFLVLTMIAGDSIDVLCVCLYLWLYPSFIKLVVREEEGKALFTSILWLTLYCECLLMLNCVDNYPANGDVLYVIRPWVIVCIIILLYKTMMKYKHQWRAIFLVQIMIVIPVFQTPPFCMRQIVSSFVFEPPVEPGKESIYSSHIGWKHGIQLGTASQVDGRKAFIAMVYFRDGMKYHYKKTIWLSDGQGNIGEQKPKLPWVLKTIILPSLDHKPKQVKEPK